MELSLNRILQVCGNRNDLICDVDAQVVFQFFAYRFGLRIKDNNFPLLPRRVMEKRCDDQTKKAILFRIALPIITSLFALADSLSTSRIRYAICTFGTFT